MEKLRAKAERFYQEASLEEIVQLTRLVESLFEARRLLPKQGAHQIIDDRSLRLRCGDKLSAYRFFSLSWNKASCFRKKRFSAAKAVRVRKPAAQKLTQSETRISNATLSFRSCRKKPLRQPHRLRPANLSPDKIS